MIKQQPMVSASEKQEIQALHLTAFGEAEGPIIDELVGKMLSSQEAVSINEIRDDRIIGNIIFTPFLLNDHPDKRCYLLAPLGVLPEYQGEGIGKDLIDKGIKFLESIGADAVFVLGYPTYYGSLGFYPTYVCLPYQTDVVRVDAWKMKEITPGSMAEVGGTSVACDAIMKPEFWDITRTGEYDEVS